MQERIQVLVDSEDKERMQRHARAVGQSLSAWLRELALEKLRSLEKQHRFGSAEQLEQFFSQCEARETGQEPDWDQHQSVIENSINRGAAKT